MPVTLNNAQPEIFPVGFDRADGALPITYPGTPLPDLPGILSGVGINHGGTLGYYSGGEWPGYPIIFEEYSDSPNIETAEQSTVQHRFIADVITAQNILITYPRGTLVYDSYGYGYRILSVTMQPIAKTGGYVQTLNVTMESIGFGTPPDEFSVQIVEINPALEKHPRYGALTYQERFAVRNANLQQNLDVSQQIQNVIQSFPGSGSLVVGSQWAEAQEMLLKLFKGEDSFYLAGFKVTWSTYFWLPPTINPGGYIEDPVSQGNLPYQFWSTDNSGNPDSSIFSSVALVNGNMYNATRGNGATPPFGLSWLRQSDDVILQRTWFRLTRTWIGAPLGVWDNELYNPVPAPYQTQLSQGAYN